MPGRVNGIIYAENCDFSGVANAELANGLTTNGQLWIGSTALNAGGTHINVGEIVSATLDVTFDSGDIRIENRAFTWTDVSGGFSPTKNNGYFVTGTATANLPAAAAQGDTIKFFVDHASQVLTIDAPGTQIIRMGSLVTSAGGTAVSTAQGDSVELVYRAANTCWEAVCGFSGTWVLS